MWRKMTSFRFVTALGMLLCVALQGCTASTVIFPKNPLDKKTDYTKAPPDWLASVKGDDAYVQITARIDAPTACITPIANSWFHKEQIGLVLSIRRQGFEDPPGAAVDLPLATYQFSGRGNQYCWTPLIQRSIVVPYATFKTGGAPELTLLLTSSTSAELTVVQDAQILLGIATAMAAAPTVAAAPGGPAVTTISMATSLISSEALMKAKNNWEQRDARFLSGSVRVELNWGTLKSEGINSVRIPIYAGEAKGSERLSEAINRLSSPDNIRAPIFFVILEIEYKRSLFVDTYDPAPNDIVPNQKTLPLSKEQLLNRKITGQLTVLQSLNAELPNALTTLGGTDWSQCRQTQSAIESLGFSRYDRAILYHAILDQARPQWRSDRAFIDQCVPPRWAADINSVYGAGHIPTRLLPRPNEVATTENRDQNWIELIAPKLNDIREILLLRGSDYNREIMWTQMQELGGPRLGGTAFKGGTWNEEVYNKESATSEEKFEELARIEAVEAGCFVPTTDPKAGLLLFNLRGQEGNGWWSLIVKYDGQPGQPLTLHSVWIQRPRQETLQYVEKYDFNQISACAAIKRRLREEVRANPTNDPSPTGRASP
jgi:hypothetical protein